MYVYIYIYCEMTTQQKHVPQIMGLRPIPFLEDNYPIQKCWPIPSFHFRSVVSSKYPTVILSEDWVKPWKICSSPRIHEYSLYINIHEMAVSHSRNAPQVAVPRCVSCAATVRAVQEPCRWRCRREFSAGFQGRCETGNLIYIYIYRLTIDRYPTS